MSLDKETKIILSEIKDDIAEIKSDNKEMLRNHTSQEVKTGQIETQVSINTKGITRLDGLVWKLIITGLTSGSIGGGIVAAIIKGA